MGNFREIARDLLARGAAARVADPADLGRQAGVLLGDPARREAICRAQAGWRRDTGGGVARTLSEIRRELAGRA